MWENTSGTQQTASFVYEPLALVHESGSVRFVDVVGCLVVVRLALGTMGT